MKLLTDLALLNRIRKPIVLAVGFFDGIHRGHQKLLARTIQQARKDGGQAWALTFDTHPLRVLRPDIAPLLLTSNKHRAILLDRTGIDGCVVMPFNKRVAALSGAAFIKTLVESTRNLTHVLVGCNWRFGHRGEGNIRLLTAMGKRYGFGVSVVRPVVRYGSVVSSTRIREMIIDGDLVAAAALLGRPVSVLGTVVKGRAVGRTLGFPTANLCLHNEVVPPLGVYAVRALLDSVPHDGVLNLGIRPTFNEKPTHKPIMEIHLFDVSKQLYGKDIEVFFVSRIRAERRFSSREELARNIDRDTRKARDILAGKKLKESLYTYSSLVL